MLDILVPFLAGLGLAVLLWRKRWTLTLCTALALLLISAAAYGAIALLPPKAYSLLPVQGRHLTSAGWFLGIAGVANLMALIGRLVARFISPGK